MEEILLSLLKVILSTDAEHAQYMLNHSWLEISVLHKSMRAKFPLQDDGWSFI